MANYRAKEIIIIMIKQFANRRRVKRERGGGETILSHPSPPSTTPPHIPPYPRESCTYHAQSEGSARNFSIAQQ